MKSIFYLNFYLILCFKDSSRVFLVVTSGESVIDSMNLSESNEFSLLNFPDYVFFFIVEFFIKLSPLALSGFELYLFFISDLYELVLLLVYKPGMRFS